MVLLSDIKKCSPIQYQYFHLISNSVSACGASKAGVREREMKRKGERSIYLMSTVCSSPSAVECPHPKAGSLLGTLLDS